MSPADQSSLSVCMIWEGHYHLGAAALINSLVAHGFSGNVWIATRGRLPQWVKSWPSPAPNHYTAAGLNLHFVPVEATRSMSAEKPRFMLQVLEELDPLAAGLVYLDADMVVNVPWQLIESWVQCGIALCEDNCFGSMAGNHLLRVRWTQFAKETLGLSTVATLNRAYNAGFVGVLRTRMAFLNIWDRATSLLPVPEPGSVTLKVGTRWHPFNSLEQDTLNITTMVCTEPLATLGPEGMGFAPGLAAVLHAVDNPKPWKKGYLSHLLRTGAKVGDADRAYWKHACGLISPWPAWKLWLHRVDLFCAIVLSRFYHSA